MLVKATGSAPSAGWRFGVRQRLAVAREAGHREFRQLNVAGDCNGDGAGPPGEPSRPQCPRWYGWCKSTNVVSQHQDGERPAATSAVALRSPESRHESPVQHAGIGSIELIRGVRLSARAFPIQEECR